MNSAGEIGAFFDIDGTLVPNPSLEWRFIAYLLSRDQLRFRHLGNWAANFVKNLPRGWNAAMDSNKRYLVGLPESLATEWRQAALSAESSFRIPLFPGGIERVIWHASQQHRIFLVTGTLEPLARAVADAIEEITAIRGVRASMETIATTLESTNGIWTGRIAGEHMSGAAKAAAMRDLAEKLGIHLEMSHAYGDRWSDLPMLRAAGHPTAVNPGTALERVAYAERWQVRRWQMSAQASFPADQIPSFNGAR